VPRYGRRVRHAGWRPAIAGLAVTALALTAGCTSVVPGSASAAPPTVPREPAVAPTTVTPSPTPGAPPGPRAGLDADPFPDECLLNASEFGALVGAPVRPPEQGTVRRSDGSSSSSCVATADHEPAAMINVYTVKSGTPADYVRAGGTAGRHELPGVGDAAVVVETETGPTLQLASPRYLVTILVAGSTPSQEQWRAAALAALGRLPA
jgi:hypothetical protein